jgi:hypothetical protein
LTGGRRNNRLRSLAAAAGEEHYIDQQSGQEKVPTPWEGQSSKPISYHLLVFKSSPCDYHAWSSHR